MLLAPLPHVPQLNASASPIVGAVKLPHASDFANGGGGVIWSLPY